MIALCVACAGGPVSVEGHPSLRASSLGASAMAFSCLRCPALWSRTYSNTGAYTWAYQAQPGSGVGASLPPTTSANDSRTGATMDSAEDAQVHWRAIQASWKRPRRFPT